MNKPALPICENKGADQLHNDRTADQSLCFCYVESIIPLLHKLQASSHHLWLYSMFYVWPGLKPEERFSHDAAHLKVYSSELSYRDNAN